MTAQELLTPGGRPFLVLGNPEVVTLERLERITQRLDSDPRIASVSVVAHRDPGQEYLRATAPAGCAVLVATDVSALAGPIRQAADTEELSAWARSCSERGLWHDWWLAGAPDVAQAKVFINPSHVDARESSDLSSSHYSTLSTHRLDPTAITMTIDVTWLGPHQTGAQVLTTSAVEALARHPQVSQISLTGVNELPPYAAHLTDLDAVYLADSEDQPDISDIIWYPNQIDQRVNVSQARHLGRRVITTYLDLIAYDIPRYHASSQAWAAYRALQRRIALSVDGVTTISADVARRLSDEVPRLDRRRIEAIPLGLDHITPVVGQPDDSFSELASRLGSRPFVLVLGNDFQHKNRDFALQVWEKVLSDGVNCDLVLAGLHVKSSSSQNAEAVLLEQHTNLRGTAHILGHVSESDRAWLLTHASAVLYPSSAEGFGFVPYEAAALGTPSTFTDFGPLAELSGASTLPRRWSVEEHAADLRRLLVDPDAAKERVTELRATISELTWDRFAERMVAFMCRVDELPPVEAAVAGGSADDSAALASILNSRTWRATAPLRKFGRRRSGS